MKKFLDKTVVLTIRQLVIKTLLLIAVLIVLLSFLYTDNTEARHEVSHTQIIFKDTLSCPEDGLVPHPCRQPDDLITVKISHYWPPLGGTNCLNFVNNYCHSSMASGQRWEDWIDKAIACPSELPFWTIVEFRGRRWICLDRGGAIDIDNNAYWVDTLTELPVDDYGSLATASVWLPN